MRAILFAVAIALAACAGPDDDPAPACAPADPACASVSSCDFAHAFACGYGRAADGGWSCGPSASRTAADCPTPYVLCRDAGDGALVLCPRP